MCFTCGNRIGDIAHGSSPVAGPTSATALEPGAASDRPAGPLPPAPGTTWGAPATAPTVTPSRAGFTLAVVLAVVGLAGVLAFLLLRGGGPRFPDRVAGHERNRSDQVQQIEELISDIQVGDMQMDVAVYGEDIANPAAMLMVIRGAPEALVGGTSEEFFQGVPSQVMSNGQASVDFSRAVKASVEGVDYLCVPVQAPTSTGFGPIRNATACVFRGEVLGLVLFSSGPSPISAMTFTQQAYRELD
jgi:hypothetical protein